MSLHPTMATALAPFAPADSEARRLAADLSYNQQKNDGTLRRQEDDRAVALDFQAEHGGPVPLFGLHKCPSDQAARRWPTDFTDTELCAADLAVKAHKESGAELQVAIAREVKAINDAGGNSHA